MSKEKFLKEELIQLFSSLDGAQKAKFGKMNVHQMIEHFTDSIQIAYGKLKFETKNSSELINKMHRFMMSDKPFRENTPNPNVPDVPPTPRHTTIELSLEELRSNLNSFFNYYIENEGVRVPNPFFGDLNYDEQIHLLHKHALHHLKQFGIDG